MKPNTFVSSVIAIAAVALCACAADTPSPEASADDEIVVKVLQNSATVSDGQLVFPKEVFPDNLRQRITRFSDALAAGKTKADVENVILRGDREEGAAAEDGEIKEDVGNPYGYIRRALSWRDEGDTTIVTTELADVWDAIGERDANGEVEIGSVEPKGLGVSRQGLQKAIPFKLPLVKLDGKELFRKGDASLTITTGTVVVDATVDFGADVGLVKVKSAHLVVDGDVDADLVLHAVNKGPFDQVIDKEVFHKKYKLAGVGPVSLSMDVVVNVSCDVDADGDLDVEGGFKVRAAKFKGGVTYDKKDGAKPVFEAPTFQPTAKPPTNFVAKGAAKTVCTLKPTLQVLLFDRPGPAMVPVIVSKLAVSNPPRAGSLTASMSGRIAGTLSAFGKDLASIDKELPTIDRTLWTFGK